MKKQKERCKKGRDNLKKQLSKKKPSREALQKKQHQLQQQRKRQAKYMEKRFLNISEENHVKSKKGTVATRNKMQSKREYNRDKQRICRSKMTSQKKNWIKKKDRERKRAKRQSVRNNIESPELENKQTCTVAVQSSNLGETNLIDELRKTPKGKSAIIGAARSLVQKGYCKKFLAERYKLNRRTLSARSKLQKKTRINVKKYGQFTLEQISRELFLNVGMLPKMAQDIYC